MAQTTAWSAAARRMKIWFARNWKFEEASLVLHITARFVFGIVLVLTLLAPVRAADDNRDFLIPPETPEDYWKRVKFEIEVGKFDFAGKYLKGFLGALAKLKPEEASKKLITIEKEEGMSAFLRLKQIPE